MLSRNIGNLYPMSRSWSIWKLWWKISSAGISEFLQSGLAGSSTHKCKSYL